MTWTRIPFARAFVSISDHGRRVKQKDYLSDGAVPVVDQGAALVGGFTDNGDFVVDSEPPTIVFGDHTRRVKYVDFPFAVGADGVKLLKPREELLPKFAYWFLCSVELADRGYGRHFALLRGVDVPVPPLDEQRRIVDLLEDHLSRLDAADAGIADAGRRASALRWSALSTALREIDGQPVTLGELASVKNGIYVSRPQTDPNGVPILRIGAIRPLSLELSDLRYSAMLESEVDAMDGLLKSGDLLFTRYNGNSKFVGACAVVTDSLLPLTYPDKLIRVRPDTERVVPEFLAVACSVGFTRAQIQTAVKTTSGQAGISGRDLKAVEVSLPSVQDQSRIAQLSIEVASATGRLRSSIRETQMRSAALRRSLLAAAFSGRLTSHQSIGKSA